MYKVVDFLRESFSSSRVYDSLVADDSDKDLSVKLSTELEVFAESGIPRCVHFFQVIDTGRVTACICA